MPTQDLPGSPRTFPAALALTASRVAFSDEGIVQNEMLASSKRRIRSSCCLIKFSWSEVTSALPVCALTFSMMSCVADVVINDNFSSASSLICSGDGPMVTGVLSLLSAVIVSFRILIATAKLPTCRATVEDKALLY